MVRMCFGHIAIKIHNLHMEDMLVRYIRVDGMYILLIEELHMVVRVLHVVQTEHEVLNMVLIIFLCFAIMVVI